jgi:hypothetical protein
MQQAQNNNNNLNRPKNKIFILFPIELLNNNNNYKYNNNIKAYILYYLILTAVFLLYILNIINFITHNYSSNIIKFCHLCIILFTTYMYVRILHNIND